MASLGIKQGFNTVGHIYNSRDDVSIFDDNIKKVLTVDDGNWLQWDSDDPTFADFEEIEGGKGYLFESIGDTTINLSSNDEITLGEIPVNVDSLDMIAITANLPLGMNSRFNPVVAYYVDDGNWLGWNKDEIDFADFDTFEKGRGYLISADAVYDGGGEVIPPPEPDPDLSNRSAGILPMCVSIGIATEFLGFDNLDTLAMGVRFALYNKKH